MTFFPKTEASEGLWALATHVLLGLDPNYLPSLLSHRSALDCAQRMVDHDGLIWIATPVRCVTDPKSHTQVQSGLYNLAHYMGFYEGSELLQLLKDVPSRLQGQPNRVGPREVPITQWTISKFLTVEYVQSKGLQVRTLT